MFKFVIETEEGELTVVRVNQDEVTIGRNDTNTICLTEQNVSRRHARVYRENGNCFVEDLSVSNRVMLNGSPLAGRGELREGDNMQIGDYLIGLRAPGQDADTVEDTDRFVVAKGEAPAPVVTLPPRLVLTSVGFEGKEVRLEQDVIVIGRAVDNDIILEHWSIWPHHARLFRDEQGNFHIEDLRGPNSVRVNGRAVERIELKSGHIIEMGQIQIRFVGAGETFVYRPPRARVPRSVVWMALGVGVLGLGGTLIALRTLSRPGRARPPAVSAPKVEPPEVVFARELEKVDAALKIENWMAAIDACVRLEPQDSAGACRARRARAEAEQGAKMAFLAFRDAAERGDTDLAVTKYQTIPDESVYHGQSQVLWPVVRDAYAKLYLPQATKAMSAGRCEEARALADRVASVDEANTGLLPIRKRCPTPTTAPASPRVASAPAKPRPPATPKPSTPKPTTADENGKPAEQTKPPGPPAPPVPEPEGPSVAEQAAALVEEANQHWEKGDNSKAIQAAQKALKIQPGDPKAVRIIGAASCDLKDKAKAVWAYERLSPANQQFLVSVCQRNKITIP